MPELKVRVSGRGSKTFVVLKRWGGAKNPSARTIGRFGKVGLADARKIARDWLEMRTRGLDPKGHKPTGNVFGDLFSKAAARLKEIMTAELDREPNFVLHDVRRTTRTGLAMVG